jgi:hypothetical protein
MIHTYTSLIGRAAQEYFFCLAKINTLNFLKLFYAGLGFLSEKKEKKVRLKDCAFIQTNDWPGN